MREMFSSGRYGWDKLPEENIRVTLTDSEGAYARLFGEASQDTTQNIGIGQCMRLKYEARILADTSTSGHNLAGFSKVMPYKLHTNSRWYAHAGCEERRRRTTAHASAGGGCKLAARPLRPSSVIAGASWRSTAQRASTAPRPPVPPVTARAPPGAAIARGVFRTTSFPTCPACDIIRSAWREKRVHPGPLAE
eukprot:1191408-Prorocentrum_minimum.AAC.2